MLAAIVLMSAAIASVVAFAAMLAVIAVVATVLAGLALHAYATIAVGSTAVVKEEHTFSPP